VYSKEEQQDNSNGDVLAALAASSGKEGITMPPVYDIAYCTISSANNANRNMFLLWCGFRQKLSKKSELSSCPYSLAGLVTVRCRCINVIHLGSNEKYGETLREVSVSAKSDNSTKATIMC
jgi:hypothetical protein